MSAISRTAALKVAGFFVLLSSLWIVLSDGMIYLHGEANAAGTLIGIAKGLAYVSVTAAALYLFMTRWVRERAVLGERLKRLSRYANDIVLTLDDQGRVIDANDRAAKAYGLPHATLTGMSFRDLRADGGGEGRDWEMVTTEGHVRFETMHKRADGSVFPVEISARRVSLEGRPVVQSIIRDISERKKMEFELRKLSMAIEQSPVTVVITDADGCISYANPAFTATSGYSLEEALGKSLRILESGHTSPEEYRRMWQCIAGGQPWSGLFQNRRKDGTLYWEEATIAPIRDESGAITQFIAVKQDVTKRREAEENAAFLAHHDALTRLPNRALGRDRMERVMVAAGRAGTKAALMIVNLDHFKRINDSLGPASADALLQSLATRIAGCLRETDTLSRQGSDEFLVTLAGVEDAESINRVAADILERTHAPFSIEGEELSITVSIGISLYPDDGGDFDMLLRRANTAMRHAKEAGRNTYRFFAKRMNVDASEYLTVLNGLRRALERGEFVLHYQPQIGLADGRLLGAEALIRWEHPTLGRVAPGRFIPIAEESGLIVEMSDWVLREACREAVRWQSGGRLGVAVNLSAVQFERGGLVESVSQALAESGLDPSCLELELTESMLIKDAGRVLATVKQLKGLGVKLSIDDFGTGYSSLAYLRLLDLDKLKIDRSFVRDVARNHSDETIVKAIVQLAQGLGLRTVAEGVETVEALDVVRRHGCDEVQGYHFARPMPAEDFLAYADRRDRRDQRLALLAGSGKTRPA